MVLRRLKHQAKAGEQVEELSENEDDEQSLVHVRGKHLQAGELGKTPLVCPLCRNEGCFVRMKNREGRRLIGKEGFQVHK